MLKFCSLSCLRETEARMGFCCFAFFNKFIYFLLHWVFVAARGLSVVAASGGLLFVLVCGLLIAVASLVAEHGL